MDGKVRAPIDDESRQTLLDVHRAYDMERHTRAGSPQASQLTADFVDRFGILGPPEHCIARLRELAALGIERFIVVGPSIDADREEGTRARQLFVDEVLPAFRDSTTTTTTTKEAAHAT